MPRTRRPGRHAATVEPAHPHPTARHGILPGQRTLIAETTAAQRHGLSGVANLIPIVWAIPDSRPPWVNPNYARPVGRPGRRTALILWIAAIAVAYFVTAQVGLRMALVGDQVTALWPPTGIGVACLVLLGLRTWPGIALGAFAVNISLGPTLPAVLIIAAGNTAAPIIAYLLLHRAGFHRDFDRIKDALALVFLGALTGMLVSSTVGSLTLFVTGRLAARDLTQTWAVWWTGDAMGVLTVTPLIFLIAAGKPKKVAPLRAVEATALITGTLLVVLVATTVSTNLLFLVFPFVIWAAMRFHLAGAIPCAFLASVATTYAASRDFPAFADLDLTTKMIALQSFNGSIALTALLHATITAQRDRARRAVDEVCAQLIESVAVLNRGRTLENLTDLERRLHGRGDQSP